MSEPCGTPQSDVQSKKNVKASLNVRPSNNLTSIVQIFFLPPPEAIIYHYTS